MATKEPSGLARTVQRQWIEPSQIKSVLIELTGSGFSTLQIAAELTRRGITTARGGGHLQFFGDDVRLADKAANGWEFSRGRREASAQGVRSSDWVSSALNATRLVRSERRSILAVANELLRVRSLTVDEIQRLVG